MKLEVVVIPMSDVDRAKRFSAAWAGGSTPTSPKATRFGSSASGGWRETKFDVRFWHKADITALLIHVRFWG
jgi:hypothetical protein